jgi:hypothetical protein
VEEAQAALESAHEEHAAIQLQLDGERAASEEAEATILREAALSRRECARADAQLQAVVAAAVDTARGMRSDRDLLREQCSEAQQQRMCAEQQQRERVALALDQAQAEGERLAAVAEALQQQVEALEA